MYSLTPQVREPVARQPRDAGLRAVPSRTVTRGWTEGGGGHSLYLQALNVPGVHSMHMYNYVFEYKVDFMPSHAADACDGARAPMRCAIRMRASAGEEIERRSIPDQS